MTNETMRKNDGALLLGRRGSDELDSKGAGAVGGIGDGEGVAGGGGSPRSNQDGARARRRKGGVGGGVSREGHGSCTRLRRLSELNDRLIGADRGVGGGERRDDPPVR